jgi:superfamily I DNA/RNA helicase
MDKSVDLANKIDKLNIERIYVTGVPGSGKTLLAASLSNIWSSVPSIYLSFGKENAKSARTILNPRTKCCTFHSLAYEHLGLTKDRVISTLTINHVRGYFKNIKDVGAISLLYAEAIRDLVGEYAQNNSQLHQMKQALVSTGFTCNLTREQKGDVFSLFKMFWLGVFNDPKSKVTHDMYLKEFAVNPGRLGYEKIIVDESQDLTPLMWMLLDNIALKNACQTIILGDPSQQINKYKGASSLLSEIKAHFVIDETHRFGQRVATIANKLMTITSRENYTPIKTSHDNSIIHTGKSLYDLIDLSKTTNMRLTYLTRYNATLWIVMLKLATAGVPFTLLGGISKKELGHVERLYEFKQGDSSHRKYFKSLTYNQYRDHLKLTNKIDMLQFCKIVEHIAKNNTAPFKDVMTKLKGSMRMHRKDAKFLLSNVHQAKGLGFSNVVLSNDFPVVGSFDKNSEEANILFTAITRVKENLFLNTDTAKSLN